MAVFGAEPGEFCDNATGDCSARDSEGHGTHTATTAAGSPVAHAPLFGIDRGPISGVAPGASVIAYRVCLAEGCFQSDSVAAIGQAITDGVDVINFSIGGGANPYSDAVELAFLDAYANGISVNASAGNSGPGAATVEHNSPWVTTVGASTWDGMYLTTLRLKADNGDTYSAKGSSVVPGISSATPVVLGQSVAGETKLCDSPFEPGSVTGKIVVCERGGNGRNEKSFNVSLGGAAGMILYNPTLQSLFTDNFWVPTVMLEGPEPAAAMVAFLTSHTGITAKWETGTKTHVRGDVMATFSSRGPGTDFIKPDVTAPGLQILAGNTPVPTDVAAGPPGQLYQIIAGTSMSSPALGRCLGAGQGGPSRLDAGPDQVRAHDVVRPERPQGGRHEGGSVRSRRRLDPGQPRAPADRHPRRPGRGVRRQRGRSRTRASTSTSRASTSTRCRAAWRPPGPSPTCPAGTRPSRSRTSDPAGVDISVSPSRFSLAPGASRTLTIRISAGRRRRRLVLRPDHHRPGAQGRQQRRPAGRVQPGPGQGHAVPRLCGHDPRAQ